YQAPINAETAKIFESDKQMNFWSIKDSARIIMDKGYKFSCKAEDISLLAYIVSPTDNGLTPEKAAALYLDVPDVTCFTAILKPLKEVLLKKLSETDGEFIYREIELPLAYLLAKTEHIGFFADKSGLTEFSQMLATKIFDDEKAIYALAGEEFNVNSPKQLGNILFEVIMLPHGKKNKSGYSTDADVLEKLSPYHPIIDLILEHRKLSKLKSTYADGLLKSISADGRIHTTFRQTLTKTGRLSSVEPNLQNIPVRTDLGREMRKFFIAEDGNLLVDADYSQIELRILAHISGDETMIDAFKNNVDIHTLTASQIFHVPLNEVTREQRKRAKAINFGIVYGIGG
ncbi:MAG: DNA polymerase, partial [Clostridia bacterium]